MRKLRIFTAIFFVLTIISYGAFSFYEHFIKDNVPPVITSELDFIECSVNSGEDELLAGLTAYDSADGDITDKIMIENISTLISKDTAKISYIVFDSANNAARYTRRVRYTDYELPKFELNGPLIFARGSDVAVFDRLSATDIIDGNISGSIRVTSQNLDNTVDGEYSITVQVTNSMGDTASLPLTVIINSASVRKQLIELSEYLVYIDKNTDFNPMDYIDRVCSAEGMTRAKSLVNIESNVDTANSGVYEVHYSYSDGGYDYLTILTVVVE